MQGALRRYWGRTWRMHTVALSCLAVCTLLVEMFRWLQYDKGSQWLEGMTLAVLFACVLLAPLMVYRALRFAFSSASRPHRVDIVLTAYFALVIGFTGIYYAMAGLGDYGIAIDEFQHYEREVERLRTTSVSPTSYARRGGPFAGIDHSLWLFEPSERLSRSVAEATDLELLEETILGELFFSPSPEIVVFDADARWRVALDCLHLSVTTMATLGFGDVAPKHWYARLATDIQVLVSVLIAVFAIGLLLGPPARASSG